MYVCATIGTQHTHSLTTPPLTPHRFLIVLRVQEVYKLLIVHSSVMIDISILEVLFVTFKCGLQCQLNF